MKWSNSGMLLYDLIPSKIRRSSDSSQTDAISPTFNLRRSDVCTAAILECFCPILFLLKYEGPVIICQRGSWSVWFRIWPRQSRRCATCHSPKDFSRLPQERDCSAKTKEDESWPWGYELVSTDIQFNIPLENGRTSCSYQVRRALGATQAYAVPSVCLSFLPLHRNSCFSCSQWHCANDRQRENKRAGSTRSQSRLWHRAPSGAATGSTQTCQVKDQQSSSRLVDCSVPQGSVLGSQEFIAYTEDLAELTEEHLLGHHMYADGTQLMAHLTINDIPGVATRLQNCIKAIQVWCKSRRLQLNPTKTELIWFGSKTNLKKIADLDLNLYIGLDIIKPVNVVRDLGVYLDSKLSMKHHVSTVVRACFFHLRCFKSFRRILAADVTSSLVSAFVTTKMDYCIRRRSW